MRYRLSTPVSLYSLGRNVALISEEIVNKTVDSRERIKVINHVL